MRKDLLKKGFIKKIESNSIQVNKSLELVERDLKVAKTMLIENNDWAYNISYNSILQAIKALMFSEGYKTSNINSHVSTIEFAKDFLDKSDIIYLNRMRRKRHKAVYEISGSVTNIEAKNSVHNAEKIVSKIKMIINEQKKE
ncbi:MAG: HEPN domain-containing protein [Methanobrevibacter sp.]|jgi:uncharacterized protein (UPF0332 family)|nr:HEPN domain-containing protein [Methanobrevibacter sp.]